MKTIYKKDTKGKIRFLTIYNKGAEIIQTSGVLGTDNPVTHSKLAKPKNVGKSNETTAEQQAEKQVAALLVDKMTKGYFSTQEEAETIAVIMPQLAHTYDDHVKKIKWGKETVICQPKLDGMRCLAFVKTDGTVTLMSREGKEITTMPHIQESLSVLGFDTILDGELYLHGENFQSNMSLIKKFIPGESTRVQFCVYDVVNKEPYVNRLLEVTKTVRLVSGDIVTTIESSEVSYEAEVKELYVKYMEQGYEGAMIKLCRSGYKSNARTFECLKYKSFIDITRPIKDVIPSDANPTHGTPIFDWPGAKNDVLKAGTKLSHAQRVDLLANKEQYIGKTAELRFFEYSEGGVPRFPVYLGVRGDK